MIMLTDSKDSLIDTLEKNRRRDLVTACVCIALIAGGVAALWFPHWQKERQEEQRLERAAAMWQERCKKSGEFIHRTVDGIDRIYLSNVRTGLNLGKQYELDDPYGNDVSGDGYITSFLKDNFESGGGVVGPDGVKAYPGFRYVEAHDPKDGKLYRYSGRVVEPWLTNKNYAKGHLVFELEKIEILARSARYAVEFVDISTREERDYWVAGSSLRVIDLDAQEVIGERIGYMFDVGQGNRNAGRSPWSLAASYACPSFLKSPAEPRQHAATAQLGQTKEFVKKIIKTVP